MSVMRSGAAGFWTRRNVIQRALVVIQVSIASLALVSATFFLKSLSQAKRVDVGFAQPEQVLLLGMDFNLAQLSAEHGAAALTEITERVSGQPGVRSVSAATMVPLGAGGHRFAATVVEGYVPQPTEDMAIEISQVGADYFKTMGITIVTGRGIGPADRDGSAPVVVVNEAFANRFWPGQDPLGRQVDQGRGSATVVGVSRNGRYDNIADPPSPIVFWPLAQWYKPAVTIHVRSDGDPKMLVESLRRVIQNVNSAIPVVDPRTLAEHMQVSTFAQRIGSRALGTFGGLALMLALIGLYATISFAVRRERRTTAIRLCLGATGTRVGRRIVGGALRLTGIGLILGLAGGYATATLIAGQLPGVRPSDITAYASVAGLALAGALVAALWPAGRAARQPPMEAMRAE
jgi:predicted permease